MSPLLETFGFGSVRGWRVPSADAAGAYELIATAFGTGISGTVTFSSIPATYKHLQLRTTSRKTTTGTMTQRIGFNNDASSTYYWHRMYGNGTSVQSDSSGALTTAITTNTAPGSDNIAGAFSAQIYDILDYASTTKNKTVRTLNGHAATTPVLGLCSGVWNSTAAISTVNVTALSGALFDAGSRFSLYGIRG